MAVAMYHQSKHSGLGGHAYMDSVCHFNFCSEMHACTLERTLRISEARIQSQENIEQNSTY